MRIKEIGLFLLGIWLILYGLIDILKLSFTGKDIIMAVLAIAAGIFLLIRK
jgi:hypothetical protein